MMNSTQYLTLLALFGGITAGACGVDFDGYVFDDELLAEANGQGGDGGDGDGDESSPPSQECLDFCDDQEETCGFGEAISYESRAQCLTLCAGYFPAEMSCRVLHLGFASANPENSEYAETHCPHTKEDGGNTCPDARPFSCDRFCLRTSEACPFDADGEGVYAGSGACEDACDAFGVNGLECRFVELGLAEEGDDSRCANLLPDGGTRCGE
jgi:hypothetical protein